MVPPDKYHVEYFTKICPSPNARICLAALKALFEILEDITQASDRSDNLLYFFVLTIHTLVLRHVSPLLNN